MGSEFFSQTISNERVNSSQPFTILKSGSFKRSGRQMDITETDLDKAVDNFKKFSELGEEVSIDYDHGATLKGDSRAAGWIKDLYREDNELKATVEWTDTAKKLISGKEYRRISAEFHRNYQDEEGTERGFTLLAAGLTNRPFLRKLAPVSLSEIHGREETTERLDEITKKIDNLQETLSDTSNEMEKETVEMKETAPKEDTVTLSTQEHQEMLAEIEKSKGLEAKLEVLTEKLSEIESRSDKAEKTLFDERLGRVLDEARREGRIDAKDETTERWTKRAQQFGLDEVSGLLNELPTRIELGEIGHGRDKESGSVNLGSLFSDLRDQSLSVDKGSADLHVKALEYQKQNNVSYGDAMIAVSK